MSTNQVMATNDVIFTPEQLLEHWQGHRRLTRKLIEAFPEKEFFEFSIGGMRTGFGLMEELITMAIPGIEGIINRDWEVANQSVKELQSKKLTTKKQVLEAWDEITAKLNELFPKIEASRFQEIDKAFGLYEGPVYFLLFYWIDNEIHHRAQATVYLRALGIQPPFFWDRY